MRAGSIVAENSSRIRQWENWAGAIVERTTGARSEFRIVQFFEAGIFLPIAAIASHLLTVAATHPIHCAVDGLQANSPNGNSLGDVAKVITVLAGPRHHLRSGGNGDAGLISTDATGTISERLDVHCSLIPLACPQAAC